MNVFDQKIKNLPFEMVIEIFSYLIPNPNNIEFRKECPHSNSNTYSAKYEVAFYRNEKIMNDTNHYLSRISKKNGKHRYYLSREIIDCIEVEYNDREINIYHYDYVSTYIGKNLFIATINVVYI
jgi:hypothetical protein